MARLQVKSSRSSRTMEVRIHPFLLLQDSQEATRQGEEEFESGKGGHIFLNI